jgi:hypothetical protein
MSHLRGILVELDTDSGTDDQIYVGVVGRGGGREFPLATANFNDFEPGLATYLLGAIWQVAPANVKHPDMSLVGERNDPEVFRIELGEVDYVYIRKEGDPTASDDAYKFDSVEVKLYAAQGDTPNLRTFSTNSDLWLGNEFGHQAWIAET